jgi:hypothetical protein
MFVRKIETFAVHPFITAIAVVTMSTCFHHASAAPQNSSETAGTDRKYSLFRPTPAGQLRQMSTDRPDQTESPYTVDAGHFQVELDFVNATFNHDRIDGIDLREHEWSLLPLNLKIGLLNNVDLQLVFDTYLATSIEDRAADTNDKASGVGDVQTRLKINVWGNDGGSTAFAAMPYVKWPISESGLRNGKMEGGLIVPLGADLGNGWGMGLMAELDLVRNAADDGYNTEHVQSITFSRDITDRFGGYVEFFSVAGSAGDEDWLGQIDGGFTFGINGNTQLDLGCNLGVSDSAPDFNPFVGLSIRF